MSTDVEVPRVTHIPLGGKTAKKIDNISQNQHSDKKHHIVDGQYARYVLVVLLIVYAFNIIDRQIFTILSESIKNDLDLSDSDLGFLGGAAFAVFYAVFGLPLARLADVWNRKKLIAIGLAFWSVMTTLSGTAQGLISLALCRFGVGVGEASSTPASGSILFDYFSRHVRATVVSVYACGSYIGLGLGLVLGGWVLDTWNKVYPDASMAPLGLKGWQATFMIVGLPGVLMALWVSTLREPRRGLADEIESKQHPHPFSDTVKVILSLLPITNICILLKEGGGKKAIIWNNLNGTLIFSTAYALTLLLGNMLQWFVLAVGFYAVFSWGQVLAIRDPVAFGMLFKCKSLLYTILAMVGPNFMGVAIGFWSIPYFQRIYTVEVAELGAILGIGFIVMGVPGVLLGGYLSDKWRRVNPRGKLFVLLISISLSTLSAFCFLLAENLLLAYFYIYVMYFAGSMGYGPGGSTIGDLVLPRIRATVSAFANMVNTLLASALAPYIIGQISDSISATGVDGGEALRQGMLWSMLMPFAGIVLTMLAIQHIESDEANLKERARSLGETM